MQEKIMELIKQMVEEKGYEFIADYNYSNFGTVRCIKDFDVFVKITFNFQKDSGTAELQIFTPKKSHNVIEKIWIEYDKDLKIKIQKLKDCLKKTL